MQQKPNAKTKNGGFFASVARLWRSREDINLKSIRKSAMPYFLAFPLLMAMVNAVETYFQPDDTFFGLNSMTLLSIVYYIGSIIIFLRKKPLSTPVTRLFIVLAAAGYVFWLLTPGQGIGFLGAALSWFSFGCLVVGVMLGYFMQLNNAERLFGILLLVLFYFTGALLAGAGRDVPAVVYTSAILGAALWCIFKSRNEVPATHGEKPKGQYWIVVYIAAIQIISNFALQYLSVNQTAAYMEFFLGAPAAIVISLVMQAALRRGVWHMWNIFLALSVLGAVLLFVPVALCQQLGSFCLGTGYFLGYVAFFYMGGAIVKRYFTYDFFRFVGVAVVVVSVVPGLLAGVIAGIWPERLLVCLGIASVVSLILLTALSPVLYQKMFAPQWTKHLRGADIPPEEAREEYPVTNELFLDFIQRIDTLTPTEREVFTHYVDGLGAKEVAERMFISPNTLKNHNNHIYAKLGVSSMDELTLYISLIGKSGRLGELKPSS